MKPKEEKAKPNWLFLLIGMAIVSYLSWAIYYWQSHPDEAGQFGDMFGAVTSILTFLTVVLLIRSIKLQSEELKNSVEALKISAKELELTRKEFEKQNATSAEQLKSNKLLQLTTKKQRVESTFFNIVQLLQNNPSFNEINELNTIDLNVFRGRNNELVDKIIQGKNNRTYYKLTTENIPIITVLYNSKEPNINAEKYYRIVISIIRYLKNAPLSMDGKKSLVSILVSLMTPHQRILVLYHFKFHQDANGDFEYQTDFDFADDARFFEAIDHNLFPHHTYISLLNVAR